MTVPKEKQLDRFDAWIENSGGQTAVAKLLGLTLSAVNRWVMRNRVPSPKVAARIVELSKGKVSYADIFERT